MSEKSPPSSKYPRSSIRSDNLRRSVKPRHPDWTCVAAAAAAAAAAASRDAEADEEEEDDVPPLTGGGAESCTGMGGSASCRPKLSLPGLLPVPPLCVCVVGEGVLEPGGWFDDVDDVDGVDDCA